MNKSYETVILIHGDSSPKMQIHPLFTHHIIPNFYGIFFFFFSVEDKIIHKRTDALDPTICMDKTVGNLTLCSTEEGVSYTIMGK